MKGLSLLLSKQKKDRYRSAVTKGRKTVVGAPSIEIRANTV